MKRLLCSIVPILLLQACAIGPKSHLTSTETHNHRFVGTDSRQRVLVESDQGIFSTSGLVEPSSIICTEPSPDVATTVANSFGVGLSVLGKGTGSFSSQQVEGLVQLGERTAAIQLLRDKMYQICLAYSNGAISGTTYSLLMSRLDDSIVTLSLGDGAAGAYGRSLAGVGSEAAATAEASLVGPGGGTKIEDQAAKLATANTNVDDAASALDAHNATQPVAGKEDDYKTQTATLEKNLATAKAQRDALLQLMTSTSKDAATATGKISQLQAGGGITAKPDGAVLREMQADFLLTDVNKDLIFACMVELGLRPPANSHALDPMTDALRGMFNAAPNGTTGANYAGILLRAQSTALAPICADQLPALIHSATVNGQEFRILRAKLAASTASAQFAGEAAKESAHDRELFIGQINLCTTAFKSDADRLKACLDKIIPIEAKAK